MFTNRLYELNLKFLANDVKPFLFNLDQKNVCFIFWIFETNWEIFVSVERVKK